MLYKYVYDRVGELETMIHQHRKKAVTVSPFPGKRMQTFYMEYLHTFSRKNGTSLHDIETAA